MGKIRNADEEAGQKTRPPLKGKKTKSQALYKIICKVAPRIYISTYRNS